MPAYLPVSAGDFPAEVRSRLDRLESASRISDTGGAAAINLNGGNPSVLAPGTFASLLSGGPAVTYTVGPSGKCLVTLSMQSDITLPVSATNVMGRNEVGVELSGGNTRAISAVETMYHARSGAPSGVQTNEQVAVSRTILLEGLTAAPTTFTMKFRADKVGAVFPFVSGILLSVVPL